MLSPCLKNYLGTQAANRPPHIGPLVFPEPDLLSVLVDLYFTKTNLHYPLLHRPTFERAIGDGLHTRDAAFGATVLLVCAIASRFSDDPRVGTPGAEELSCGWQYFDQVRHAIDPLFAPPSLYHLQYYCVRRLSPILPSSPPMIRSSRRRSWNPRSPRHAGPSSGSGSGSRTISACTARSLRSRARPMGRRCRASCGSARSGCSCARTARLVHTWGARAPRSTRSKFSTAAACWLYRGSFPRSFDLELPIECDDEYWENDEDPTRAFTQPAGKPSRIAAFNHYIRLNNLLAFSLKMLVRVSLSLLAGVTRNFYNKKVLVEQDEEPARRAGRGVGGAHRGGAGLSAGWMGRIDTAALCVHFPFNNLSGAYLTACILLPPLILKLATHAVRWDPHRSDDAFFDQSAFLYSSYYQVQMTIHRPFIPMIRAGPAVVRVPSHISLCPDSVFRRHRISHCCVFLTDMPGPPRPCHHSQSAPTPRAPVATSPTSPTAEKRARPSRSCSCVSPYLSQNKTKD